MMLQNTDLTPVHHPISFVSINKCKVIYEDASGYVEKKFSNSAEARLFLQTLKTSS